MLLRHGMAAIDSGNDIRERERIARDIARMSEFARNIELWRRIGWKRISHWRDTLSLLSNRYKKLLIILSLLAEHEPERNADVGIETVSLQKREENVMWNKTKRKRSTVTFDGSQTPNRLNRQRLHTAMEVTPIITSTLIKKTYKTIVQPALQTINDDIFESTNDSLAKSVQNRLPTSDDQELLRN